MTDFHIARYDAMGRMVGETVRRGLDNAEIDVRACMSLLERDECFRVTVTLVRNKQDHEP